MKTRWIVPIADDRHIEIQVLEEKGESGNMRMMMSHYKDETFTIEEADEFYRTFGDALEAAKQLKEDRELEEELNGSREPTNTVERMGRAAQRIVNAGVSVSDLVPENPVEMDNTSRRLYEGLTTDGHETIREEES